jgi:hypothetical protein
VEQPGSQGNEFTRSNRGTVRNGVFYAVRGKVLDNKDTIRAVVSSQSVKRRQVGWCEMAPSLVISQLEQGFGCGMYARR